jgi:hypothetical protein
MPMTPVEFGKFITDKTEKWGKAVKFSGAKRLRIQSDAALRQSIEPRQIAAATLSDGALLAIL